MKRRSLCEEVSGTGCVTSLYRLLLESFKVSEKYRGVVSSYNVAGGQLNVDHVPSPEVKKVFLFEGLLNKSHPVRFRIFSLFPLTVLIQTYYHIRLSRTAKVNFNVTWVC